MFGPKLSTVFASRWKALWWSALVMMTAYCTVPAPDAPETGATAQKSADGAWSGDDALPFASDENLRQLQELRRKLPDRD